MISNQTINNLKAALSGFSTLTLKRYAGPYRHTYKWLQQTQWYSPDQLKHLQLVLLKRIVNHAYNTVPFYRNAMDADGIKPSDINRLEDIEKFRIINKADLKKSGSDMYSKKYPSLFLKTAHTGGTTGLPVPLKRDIFSIGNEHAFVRRQFDWAGLKPSDTTAYLEGRKPKFANSNANPKYHYDSAAKELTLSTFDLNEKSALDYADLIKSYNVKALIAYPSAAFVMAKVCTQNQINLHLKAVLTTAETIDEYKKNIISKAFNCDVFDFYGSSERVCYIHCCPSGTYHIIPEYGLVELKPLENSPPQTFKIIATGFWNMAMPLIRYDTKDLVVADGTKCPCGRNFPTIKKISGRESNLLTTPSAVQLGPAAIECILGRVLYQTYDMPILAARVIQNSTDTLTLEYVPAEGFSPRHLEIIQKRFNKQISSGFNAQTKAVKDIKRTPSGKFLSFVMSEHH